MRTAIAIACVGLLVLASGVSAQSLSLVKDINPGTDAGTQIMTTRDVLDGIVYFNGNDGTGKELWRTDGTAAGTYQVVDIHAAPTNDAFKAIYAWLYAFDGKIYFAADDGVNGQDPWVSDGTAQGTFRLNQLSPGRNKSKNVHRFSSTNTHVYFYYLIYDLRKMTAEYQLWKSDGTVSGTVHTGVTMPWIESYTPGGDDLFMIATDGYDTKGSGEEPWISDGSLAGTSLILDICPINGTGSNHCDVEYVPTTVNANIYASKIWPLYAGGMWFFSKSEGTNGMELWRSDGTAGGTARVTDINPGAGSSCPNFFVEMNGALYFAADDGTTGMELWKYPIPSGPAEQVKDIATGSADSEPIWLTPVDGTLYFSAWTSDGGRELWKSDGTTAGTVQVTDIAGGNASSNPNYDGVNDIASPAQDYWKRFAVHSGKVYFAADDGAGYELWESDGTAAGTTKIAAINPTTNEGSSPRYLTALCDQLLFIAYHPSYGNEWWSYRFGSNQAPVASASATLASGDAPLSVSFSSSGSYDPDGSIASWNWDFDDNSTSADQNPVHVYQNPGTYAAVLTVTDACGASATDDVTITVTGTSSANVYVADQTISRVTGGGGKIHAEDVVLIKDNTDVPVSGALVSASYAGPTSGTVTGITNASGEVTFESSWSRNPVGIWCFDVTDVQLSGYSYDDMMGEPSVCEAVPKNAGIRPETFMLAQNVPNPFSTSTTIRFQLDRDMNICLSVHDMLGRRIATITRGEWKSGAHDVAFDRNQLSSGSYLIQLVGEENAASMIMTIR